jgi:GNAT superfamily N-acetyltransferase
MKSLEIRRCGSCRPYDLLYLAEASKEAVEDYLRRGITFVGEIEDTVVAVYILIHTRPFTFELVNLAVAEAYQNQGMGKLMVKDAIIRARDLNGRLLEVGIGNSRMNQLSFYQKCGFRITGVDLDFYTKHYEEKIVENGIWCQDMIRLSLIL